MIPKRIVIPTLAFLTLVTLMPEANADEPRMLFDFDDADTGRWITVHDTVMGQILVETGWIQDAQMLGYQMNLSF